MRLLPATLLIVACGGPIAPDPNAGTTTSTSSSGDQPGTSGSTVTLGPTTTTDPTVPTLPTSVTETTGTTTTVGDSGSFDDSTGPIKLDAPPDPTDGPGCADLGTCAFVDLLFVVDNSGTNGEEQRALAEGAAHLVDGLRALDLDVNILVTTTDFGHPLCAPFNKPGYTPAKGAPINTACFDRLERFSNLDNTLMQPEMCLDVCTTSAAPQGPVIHFDSASHNIAGHDGVGDAVAEALACLIPQGIDGCGFEAPLENMLQAIDPAKDWNQGPGRFLRDGSVLAIVLIGDEPDCSTKDYSYFDPSKKDDPMYNQYWEDDPGTFMKNAPTSAICWNAGMDCADADLDGTYESCVPADKGVLQSINRYTDYLNDVVIPRQNHRVVMLALTGVPAVTAHDPNPPFAPTAGGILDLVHRGWTMADILPGDGDSPAQKEYEFGIGPGCSDPDIGQALPPGRIAAVCQSLDQPGETHCCLESACDGDHTAALDCLVGAISVQTQ